MSQLSASTKAAMSKTAALSPGEAKAIAQTAWLFGMPLVYVELQLSTNTHVSKACETHAPINQLAHFREFPDASNRGVVGFNVDTLYSIANLNLARGPWVLSVPEMGGRYWIMQLIDAWNNVPHAPGSRTDGGKGGQYAIVGPGWKGTLPKGLTELRMPTNLVLLGGRTYTGGPGDYAAVHALQDQYRLVPLSQWGKDYAPPDNVPLEPGVDTKTTVPAQVLALSPEEFFNRLNRLLVTNPPEPDDPATMQRIAKLGIAPGAEFRLDAFPPDVRQAISDGVAAAAKIMRKTPRGKLVNGWQIALDLGRYGTQYAYRAAWTFAGIGGNLAEDAVYPWGEADIEGKPYNAAHRYLLRFTKANLPPADAFWSLTMYDKDSYLVENPIHRSSLGDRSDLEFDEDGGLTLYIQSDSPGKGKESNWLPAPREGEFILALRLYAPKKEVADGTWAPPAVERLVV